MKRTIFVMLAVAALGMMTGCLHRHCRDNACPQAEACPADDGCHHFGLLKGCCARHQCRDGGQEAAAPGPSSAAVAYPYYNLRGPRDFLERNPQSIGP